jgi:7-cyano-7-deazaguanine reductase
MRRARSQIHPVDSNPLKLTLPKIDTRDNRFVGRKFSCKQVFSELTALCPVTRLPDFYTMTLDYQPLRKLIELKSLKLYLIAFRAIEILHEEITNQILEDVVNTVEPDWAKLDVLVNNRGGIFTTITREWRRQLST